ncbi:BglG family transcription antiterminator [Bacillus taeanensis]|uniref:PTS sugar transporter n=1 Tax=Bacillus taeanensis TaxID=273032 RepID=A0A366XXU4_9BACI|nr:PRD domain-containing protein [Bacillus taeanensis]RBW70717.1 PTS sugar transporter [Bacillus taeanensis]
MYISARERQILERLISRKDGITVKEIAQDIEVSERTVHRDLKGVEDLLHDYELELKKQSGVGIQIVGEDEKKKDLELFLYNLSHSEYTPEERQTLILCTLLEAAEPIKLIALANDLNVTVATVSNDLTKLNDWFESFDLSLIRRRGYGVEVTGSEQAKRRAMSSLISSNFDESEFLTVIRENIQKKSTQQINTISERLLGLVEKEKLVIVEKAIEEANNELPYSIADSAYIGLVVHLSLAIERILQGEKIEFDESYLENLQETKEYEVAEKIIVKLKKVFNIEIPDAEIGYITMHLRGAKLRHDNELLLEDSSFQVAVKARKLMQYVSERVGQDLGDDQSLFQGLVAHLKPAIYRMRQQMRIHNPLLEKIQKDYGELFQIIKEGVAGIFDTLDVPDAEIGYLVMHFGSSLEREKRESHLSALVICSSGIGSSKMLASRIQKEIPMIKTLHNASLFELKQLNLDDYDMVLSTIPLSNFEREYILVNPFLTEEEVGKIHAYIKQNVEKKQFVDRALKGEPASEFKNHKKVIQSFQSIHEYSYYILKILEGFHYKALHNKDTFENTLTDACYELFRKRIIEQPNKVVDALMEREKLGGLGIPNTSLALFHTRNKCIHEPSFTIYSLETPLEAKAMDGSIVEVKNILLLLSPEEMPQKGLELLSLISSLIIESDASISLFESQNAELIASYLSVNFENYFNEKLKEIRRG